MYRLFIIGGIVYLLSQKPKNGSSDNAQDVYPPIEGGKNLVFNKLPLNEYGLPIALHVYEEDFPLQLGDKGSLISVLQQMVNANDYGFTIPITGIYDDQTRLAYLSTSISLDAFVNTATSTPPIVGKVEIYEFKPGA